MVSRTSSFLSDNENVLSEPGRTADQAEWKVYNRQQMNLVIRRTQATMQSFSAPAAPRNDKPYHIKIIGQTSALYIEKFYAEWMFYTRFMKSQFKANQCDRFAVNPNDVKLVYAEIFLKRETHPHMLWEAEVIANPNKKRIWIDYKEFLRLNVQKTFTRMKNIYDKYLDYKQHAKQSVMSYDVHRISLMAQLIPNLKSNSKKELQNFVKELLSKHKRFLARERDMHTKIKILNRLKKIENVDYQDSLHNKQKIIENHTHDDSNKRKRDDENLINSEEQLNKKNKANNNSNSENDKKFKFNNPNQEPVKNKLWRWTKNEYKNIVDKNKCKDCDKSDCNLNNDCKNKKSKIHSRKIAFDLQAKN